jgi:hypothetical protein
VVGWDEVVEESFAFVIDGCVGEFSVACASSCSSVIFVGSSPQADTASNAVSIKGRIHLLVCMMAPSSATG